MTVGIEGCAASACAPALRQSVLQILQIGGNLLRSIFEYRRDLQPAAELFVSLID